MKLTVGERLEGAGPAQQPGGYVVTGVIRETPWHGLYTGKKVFYNFDFTSKRVRETDEVEWLDVFLRTNRYPILDDPTYVAQRRALARAEVRAILSNRHSNLWPEPLDLLEVENTRDPFAFSNEGRAEEPILIYARPQGRFTAEWQEQILPITSILSVLAELLEFVRQAHAEGLLLMGIGPSALLIDSSDRVHYVGTELVLSQQSALLKGTASSLWSRLFPADRFEQGYAAPECFDPLQRPDARSDLYSWGAITFSLLTGTDLGQVARDQGRPWALLGEDHWASLEKWLGQLPRNSVASWAEQLGIDPPAFLESWPRTLMNVLRMLLSPDPARRPRSCAELQTWLIDPPPAPVAGLVALHIGGDAARLLLDCTSLEPGLEMAIQCGRNSPPLLPTEGTTVAEGSIRPIVNIDRLPLTIEPIFYTVFTRRAHAGRRAYSSGVFAELWQPTEVNLRQWVETQAKASLDSSQPPAQVSMVLTALDHATVTNSLLPSASPRVRGWALKRLEQSVREHGLNESLEHLAWRFVADPHVELRQSAATLLWNAHATKSEAVLARLVDALEAPPIDAPVPVLHLLRQLGIAEERIARVLAQIESRRPTECPLCKKPLTLGERGTHLQAEHGYVMYQGDLLPAPAVLNRLWERVFEERDREAHEELVAMYGSLPELRRDGDAAIERYVRDLARFLLGAPLADPAINGAPAPTVPVALAYASVVAYQTNLRSSRWFLPIARALLRSETRAARDLGVQAVLPYFQEQLRLHGAVDDLRRLLAQVCADFDQTDLQIDLCRQLAQLGADAAVVTGCIEQLQEERLIVCQECQSEVRAKDLELHLRRAHQIFEFRQVRRSYNETRDAILNAICSPPTDLRTWRSLESLAEDRHPGEVDRYLGIWLLQFLRDVDPEQRGVRIVALGEVLALTGAAGRLLPTFVGPAKNASWELLAQRIALEICARAPADPAWIQYVLPFIDQKELPRRSRENAVIALLRCAGADRTLTLELLRAYTAQTSKKRGVEKLQNLEQRFGHSPAIDAVVKELDDEIRMSCPRCPTELKKKDMVSHLWEQHRLVLDGQRVREPWRVIEDWVVDYGLEKDPLVLQRCRELALQDDPSTGLARLQRLLYRRGLRDRDLLNELRNQVRARQATLCPHCCASVVVDTAPIPEPLTLESGRLEGHGYELEVSDGWLMPSLRIESPDAIVFRGKEPGRGLTRLGALILLVGPLMLAIYLFLDWYLTDELPSLLLASIAGGFGLVLTGMLYLAWPKPRPAKDRLVHAAWKILVPDILQEEMGPQEWCFLHGLVEITEQVRRRPLNRHLLQDCCEQVSEAARTDALARACLAQLCRRSLADMADRGEDPFDFVLALARECFKGKSPASFLNDLLANFHGKERSAWSNSDRNRLPVLLALEAFNAELDIDDWFSLGRAFQVVGSVLNLEHRWHWLQFFAIWDQRNRRPWENAGNAVLMIEMAQNPGEYEEILAHYPDTLFYVPKANLVIGSRGVWIEGVCVTAFQAGAEVSMQKISGDYELTVGAVRIRCSENPSRYIDDIKRWLHYYFQEFLPTVANLARPLLESRHRMWQLSKVTCPDCGKALVPCLGDLGIAQR